MPNVRHSSKKALHLWLDSALLEQAKAYCAEKGVTMTALLTALLQQVTAKKAEK